MVTSIDRYDEVDAFVGLDLGKGEHNAIALDPIGERLFDKELTNDGRWFRAVLEQLSTCGTILFVVEQPATIGALPFAVTQAIAALVVYLRSWPWAASLTCARARRIATPELTTTR